MGNKKRESQSHDQSLVCSFLQIYHFKKYWLEFVSKIDGVKIVSKRERRTRGHRASCIFYRKSDLSGMLQIRLK